MGKGEEEGWEGRERKREEEGGRIDGRREGRWERMGGREGEYMGKGEEEGEEGRKRKREGEYMGRREGG